MRLEQCNALSSMRDEGFLAEGREAGARPRTPSGRSGPEVQHFVPEDDEETEVARECARS
jgi:hypothetical protein